MVQDSRIQRELEEKKSQDSALYTHYRDGERDLATCYLAETADARCVFAFRSGSACFSDCVVRCWAGVCCD